MSFVIYTNALSEHQLPLAKEIVKWVGENNFRYIYTELNGQKFQQSEERLPWAMFEENNREEAEHWVEDADVVLVGGMRPIELMEQRLRAGKTTLYMSERWFKPVPLGSVRLLLPGWVRLFVPSYWKMAKRFANLFKHEKYRFLPIGPWAKKDMGLMCKVFGIRMAEENVIPWGYFVASSFAKVAEAKPSDGILKILWVGRMLDWKRVDTIIRAVARVIKLKSKGKVEQRRDISLTLVGDGPERERLMKLAERVNSTVRLCASTSPIITFLPSQPIAKIREIMRGHDVYVLASNGDEGWGAVLNEALEEGMDVIGTYDAGSSAAILPKDRLYHAGDVKTLAALIEKEYNNELPPCSIGEWTAAKAAERLIALCEV